MRATRFLLPLLSVTVAMPPLAGAEPLRLRFGIAEFQNALPLRDVERIAAWGYDYAEPALSRATLLTPEELAAARKRVAASGIRVEVMNWFVLPEVKLTGPNVDREQVRRYLEKALALAESFGAKVIVFGSPGARSYPADFPKEKAWAQLKDFLVLCADVIETHKYGMVIGVEHLRRQETNIINSVAEALALAREVNRPQIRVTVDFYHMAVENEGFEVLRDAKPLIAHLHYAEPKERTFVHGEAVDPRLPQFFETLRRIGYQGRISIEANVSDYDADARENLRFLRKMASAK